MLSFRLPPFAASAVLFSLASPFLLAQASRTASKSADISFFGGYIAAHPDYGPYNSHGGSVGVDLTRYIRFPVEPSLEFRVNLHSNIAVSENSYVVGFRAAAPFERFKPYVDFLIGPGTIHFKGVTGYNHDDSKVYNFGAGIDVRATRNFAAKIDFQSQHWNTGSGTYTPTLATFGVVYTIPFRSHVGR